MKSNGPYEAYQILFGRFYQEMGGWGTPLIRQKFFFSKKGGGGGYHPSPAKIIRQKTGIFGPETPFLALQNIL